MKKYLLFLLCLIIAAGCRSYEVKVTQDKFTRSKVVKLEMWHKVIQGKLDNREANYSREIKNGKSLPAKVFFHFTSGGVMRDPFGQRRTVELEEKAYILIDNDSFNLQVKERQKDRTYEIYGNSSRVVGGTRDDLYGTVELNSEIAEKIKNANSVQYRFYASGEAVTLDVKFDQLDKLKEFFME